MRLAVVLLCASVVSAGDMPSRMAESVARMQAAIEKQRASVRRHVAADASDAAPGFFATPWLIGPDSMGAGPLAHLADPPDCEVLPADELRRIVTEAATKEGVNPMLIRAIIRRESAGHPCAVSSKGAQGLMQLMPATAADLGVTDAFDPQQNVLGGTRYIRQMLERYGGDLRLALAAYNAGPQRVSLGGAVPGIPETQSYVSAIMAALGTENEP